MLNSTLLATNTKHKVKLHTSSDPSSEALYFLCEKYEHVSYWQLKHQRFIIAFTPLAKDHISNSRKSRKLNVSNARVYFVSGSPAPGKSS